MVDKIITEITWYNRFTHPPDEDNLREFYVTNGKYILESTPAYIDDIWYTTHTCKSLPPDYCWWTDLEEVVQGEPKFIELKDSF